MKTIRYDRPTQYADDSEWAQALADDNDLMDCRIRDLRQCFQDIERAVNGIRRLLEDADFQDANGLGLTSPLL